jgi:hypothetical protein
MAGLNPWEHILPLLTQIEKEYESSQAALKWGLDKCDH